jgi:tRNA U34 5-methylaminomethyl-2-thiouridine-forming methyltransferase MnmC
MERIIKITDDGSSTLYVPELKEHYHSTFGAVQESQHVFIKNGLKTLEKEKIRILEIGFGTGLNALLTLLAAEKFQNIYYCGLELFPLNWQFIKQMEFGKYLRLTEKESNYFSKIHNSPWEEIIEISNNFSLLKLNVDLTQYNISLVFDLIYFDAFAPQIQPDLWTEKIFTDLYNAMNKNSILVTYCAKGKVRRNMQNAGFKINRLPGPPGKREMIRAIKK